MGNPYFQFKQFTVYQRSASMKVGTDGVVLGAWAFARLDASLPCRLLDVGSGTGVMALMLAQRFPQARVEGVELEAEAAREAAENAARSPWAERLHLYAGDFAQDSPAGSACFDALISNPPFFVNDLHAATEGKTRARHCTHLSHARLISRAAELLRPGGLLALILPPHVETQVRTLALAAGFALQRRTEVLSKETKKTPLRVLLEWKKERGEDAASSFCQDRLVLLNADGSRHADYKALTRDFYLY